MTAGNQYTGLTTVNAGTLNINGVNALGGGNYSGITINGGTLQYNAAAATANNGSLDVSNIGGTAKPFTVGTNGASIDTNGNAVTFANTIGNNGTGGLTKTGTGTLTLVAANTYSGATNINTGTLLLSTGSLASTAVGVTATGALTLQNATALADNATLSLATGTVLSLDAATGTSETIGNLIVDGTTEPTGTYTAAQLNGMTGNTGIFESMNGETLTIGAVPEPSTYVGGVVLLVSVVGWSLRRRYETEKSAVTI